jgi:hypothetical protein
MRRERKQQRESEQWRHQMDEVARAHEETESADDAGPQGLRSQDRSRDSRSPGGHEVRCRTSESASRSPDQHHSWSWSSSSPGSRDPSWSRRSRSPGVQDEKQLIHVVSFAKTRKRGPWIKFWNVEEIQSDESKKFSMHPGVHPSILWCTLAHQRYRPLVDEVVGWLEPHLKGVQGSQDKKDPITIGIECRQGRHRSVSFAEQLIVELEVRLPVQALAFHMETQGWNQKCFEGRCQECGDAWWTAYPGQESKGHRERSQRRR